ncbi:MAG: hypothetical protein HPY59_04600 [Anaerolineae bacterium]|nr:hypothetical protein [Anaerolineae bacterium]
MSADIRAIFNSADWNAAENGFQAAIQKYAASTPRLSAWMEENQAEDLRLSLEDFSENDQIEFSTFVEISSSKKLDQILKNLRKTVRRC